MIAGISLIEMGTRGLNADLLLSLSFVVDCLWADFARSGLYAESLASWPHTVGSHHLSQHSARLLLRLLPVLAAELNQLNEVALPIGFVVIVLRESGVTG